MTSTNVSILLLLLLLMFLVFDLILAFELPLLALISNSVPIPVLTESASTTMVVQAVVTRWIREYELS